MPNKNLKNGAIVSIGGKSGIIMECADKYKVKFDDGSFGFFDEGQIASNSDGSTLKGARTIEPQATGEDPLAQKTFKTED